MNIARLDAIYSTLLAHCLRISPEHEAAAQKRFGVLEGKEVPALMGEVERSEIEEDLLSEHLKARQAKLGTWLCLKHKFVRCELCLPEVFPPTPNALRQFTHWAAIKPSVRTLSICSLPSEYGMLLATEFLARHFDLTNVPGFYCEEKVKTPLPGASDEEQLMAWFKERLDCPWRLNFPSNLMAGSRTQLRVQDRGEITEVSEQSISHSSRALLVPYDAGTNYIVGLRIFPLPLFPEKGSRHPFVLTSRGLPGGASAVAYKGI